MTGLLLALLFSGCKKFISTDLPVTKLATASVFTSDGAATSAQLAIYAQMSPGTGLGTGSYDMSRECGTMADELTNYSTNTQVAQYYLNNMTPNNYFGCWQNAYKYIYEANSIIENVQNNANLSASIAKQLDGESKFLRAFWHFYLTNQYGDVPLVTTTGYQVNASISRTPQAQVYQQIIADLKDAINRLNVNYVDADDSTVTAERVRPNKAVAQAMLARVYLYTKQYTDAETMATMVISNPNYALTNLNAVFLKNSSEAIWQLQTTLPAFYNTSEGANFILTGKPGGGSTARAQAISPQLLAAFEPGDARTANWMASVTAAGNTYYYPYKYKVNANVAITSLDGVTEYAMVLRLAEQYLIRAEARAQQGNTSGAISDLNSIRQRAGLPPLSASLSQTQALAAVMQERRVELFTEWGHRWYDLNRTNTIGQVMGAPGNVYTAKGATGAWDATKQLFPIPLTEITNDPNLTQNQGY